MEINAIDLVHMEHGLRLAFKKRGGEGDKNFCVTVTCNTQLSS